MDPFYLVHLECFEAFELFPLHNLFEQRYVPFLVPPVLNIILQNQEVPPQPRFCQFLLHEYQLFSPFPFHVCIILQKVEALDHAVL